MLWVVIAQECLSISGRYRLTSYSDLDIFGPVYGFNERTPQSIYLVGDTVHILWTRGGKCKRQGKQVQQIR